MDKKELTTQWINRWMCLLLIILTSEYAEASEDQQKKVTTACYGTIENFLEPKCLDGGKIAVNSVLYGAKAETRQCPMVTNSDNYSPHCCAQEPGDCVFVLHVNTTYHAHCSGQYRCELQAVWTETKGHCNDGPYHSYTNFMVMEYYCIGGAKGNVTTAKTTGEITDNDTVTPSMHKTTTDTTVIKTVKSTTSRPVTTSHNATTVRSSPKTTQRIRTSPRTTQRTRTSPRKTQRTSRSPRTTQQTSTVKSSVSSRETSTENAQQTDKLASSRMSPNATTAIQQDSTTTRPIDFSETDKMTIFPGIYLPESSTSDIEDNINFSPSSNYTPLQISDQVIGGIIAGGIGMLVTAIGFFLYCRRSSSDNENFKVAILNILWSEYCYDQLQTAFENYIPSIFQFGKV